MLRILTVDDAWQTRGAIINALEGDDFEIIEANSAETAVDILTDDIDCMLLDMKMPDMNGIQVLETLQKRHSTVPVIILSEDVQDSTRQRCIAAGAKKVLPKSSRKEVLAKTLKEILGTHHA